MTVQLLPQQTEEGVVSAPRRQPGPGTLRPESRAWSPGTSHRTQAWVDLRRRIRDLGALPPTKLWFVRHGQTRLNALGLVTGASDAPLTAAGRRQAVVAGTRLGAEPIDIAFSSHLQRSRETCALVLEAAGQTESVPRIEDVRLAERALGVLEGRPRTYIPEFAAGDLEFAPEGGEAYSDVAYRSMAFLLDVAMLSHTAGGLTLLISTHMGPLRVFHGILTEQTSSAEVLRQTYRNSAFMLAEINRLRWPGFLEPLLKG